MNLSPVEAVNRINESVTVEMPVQKTKLCSGSQQCFLDSEPNRRDPKNLGVVITVEGRPKFTEAGKDLASQLDKLQVDIREDKADVKKDGLDVDADSATAAHLQAYLAKVKADIAADRLEISPPVT